MELDFHYEVTNNPCMVYRITYPGMTVRLKESSLEYQVRNISSNGIALKNFTETQSIGTTSFLTILINGQVFLADLPAELVHLDVRNKFAGFDYRNLTRHQEQKLDVFILKLQKLEIQRHKYNAQRDEDEDECECFA